ncbi:MAG: CDP-diacylglycerol--glycerol-3-phosphate 3-phosphatidyltransferase [Nitrospinae bacterium]|nr:CDP-diacylglycerol--glycerol-3-phosphate 3-phosphatidyltransferase [Nitrospinota bacterium]
MFELTPNQITMARVYLLPLVVLLIFYPFSEYNIVAALVFGAAAATDWLDGYLARLKNQVTELGKLLDPIADKLLLVAALVPLVSLHRVPAWIAVIILSREFAVTGLRSVAAYKGKIIAADKLGKYKVGTQITGIILLILNWNLGFINFYILGNIVIFISMILAVISGYLYFKRYWDTIKESEHDS